MNKKLVLITITAVLLTFAGVYCSGGGETYQVDGVYTFTINDLEGNPKNFADLRGKGVMINVWATWCGPCKDEIPVFIKLYDKYKDRGFEIWGVSTDVQGKSIVEPFVEKMAINYPVLLGKEADLKKIFSYIRGYPTTFFFDAEGKMVKRITGQPYINKDKGETLESFFEKEILNVLSK